MMGMLPGNLEWALTPAPSISVSINDIRCVGLLGLWSMLFRQPMVFGAVASILGFSTYCSQRDGTGGNCGGCIGQAVARSGYPGQVGQYGCGGNTKLGGMQGPVLYAPVALPTLLFSSLSAKSSDCPCPGQGQRGSGCAATQQPLPVFLCCSTVPTSPIPHPCHTPGHATPQPPGLDIAQLEADVQSFFEQGLAPSTNCTYESARRRYPQFCTAANILTLPLTEDTLCKLWYTWPSRN